MSKTYKIVDLFAGMAGLSTGVERAISNNGDKFEIVFTSEIKPAAIQTLEANGRTNIQGDITKIDVSEIPSHDILLAGFPRQAFASGGNRAGFADTRGTLFLK